MRTKKTKTKTPAAPALNLKNCPFCGGSADARREFGYGGTDSKIYITCLSCHARSREVRVVEAEGPEAAVKAVALVLNTWNDRCE